MLTNVSVGILSVTLLDTLRNNLTLRVVNKKRNFGRNFDGQRCSAAIATMLWLLAKNVYWTNSRISTMNYLHIQIYKHTTQVKKE